MRIVVDLHLVESGDWAAQDGTEVPALVHSLISHGGEHELLLVLDGANPDHTAQIRAIFADRIPRENIRTWHVPGGVAATGPATQWFIEVSSIIRHACLLHLRPDIVLIPFNPNRCSTDAVPALRIFHPDLLTAIILEGAVPKTPGQESTLPSVKDLTHLKGADMILVAPPLTVEEVYTRTEALRGTVRPAPPHALPSPAQATILPNTSPFLALLEELSQSRSLPRIHAGTTRPKLAYVSPLPPEKSGISEYSAVLLPELARFYDIEVIVAQETITVPWINENCVIRRADWFLNTKPTYNRIIYHLGNSPYHQHMFEMLSGAPGVVILHDFYLGDIQAYRENQQPKDRVWTRALYHSHGWGPTMERFNPALHERTLSQYPANLEVIEKAVGVIVHSSHSISLAQQWYGSTYTRNWAKIPLMRATQETPEKGMAKEALGIPSDSFLVCTFGILGPSKLTHSILDAWLASELHKSTKCLLVFVGDLPPTETNTHLLQKIYGSVRDKSIRVTGWVDPDTYHRYLSAADLAVQFRTESRGETSAAVLDAMNYGIPTIVNAHGSMAELAPDSVWMLPDAFETEQLVEALNGLWRDERIRDNLGRRAKNAIVTTHLPRSCAELYFESIERFYSTTRNDLTRLAASVAALHPPPSLEPMCIKLARAIARSTPPVQPLRQLLIDVSVTCRNDLRTGVQRVVRSLVWALIHTPPPGVRIEPVYLSDQGQRWHYRYARKWTASALGIANDWIDDVPVEFLPGDQLLAADFAGMMAVEANRAGLFQQLSGDGVELTFLAYDLLPVLMPQHFPRRTSGYSEWLTMVTHIADKVVCISQTVASDLEKWITQTKPERMVPLSVGWFHLGADLASSVPTAGLPSGWWQLLQQISNRPSFLMVGTVEPRKAHRQSVEAFSRLWAAGKDINLVIVGNEGWKNVAPSDRRVIQEITSTLRSHPEAGNRLLWVKDASDEQLEQIYCASTCLLASAEGEGFGLPLIEAARSGLPIIARDIPVFREVAGEHAYYFKGDRAEDISDSVSSWMSLLQRGEHPKSSRIQWLTWKQSAAMLLSNLETRSPEFA